MEEITIDLHSNNRNIKKYARYSKRNHMEVYRCVACIKELSIHNCDFNFENGARVLCPECELKYFKGSKYLYYKWRRKDKVYDNQENERM